MRKPAREFLRQSRGAGASAVEKEFLDFVAQALTEMHPSAPVTEIRLDDSLQDDLAMDSMARAELSARMERYYGVHLSDEIVARALTVGDLLKAMTRGERAERLQALPQMRPVVGVRREEPRDELRDAQTWLDVLKWRAEKSPDRAYVEFMQPDQATQALTFGGLYARSLQAAAVLRKRGLELERPVAMMLPSGLEFFYAYFGVLLAGGIPVPLYPPSQPHGLGEQLKRQAGILSDCEARTLITFRHGRKVARLLRAALPGLRTILSSDELLDGSEPSPIGAAFPESSVGRESTALLQYTSGSTGDPKGVILSHANLLANVRAMGQAVRASSSDVFVSWLPLYHDMGLIGACLGTLYHGAFLALMSPMDFLARPSRWLWAIHRYRGTLSAAPNFAYELCLRRFTASEYSGLDLSSWRLAFNGAEPVSADTLLRFAERFGSYGFRAESFLPVYGLAESSVGLAFPPLGRKPRIERVDERPWVSCGRPLRGHRVRIVGERGRVLPERAVGHIQFQGPSSTSGYYRNPEATRSILQKSNDPSYAGTWLATGDLGFLSEGELFVTGRLKDLIIRGGQHFFPQELEEPLGDIPGIRKGCVAAFGRVDHTSGTEEVVVLAETRAKDADDRRHLQQRISQVALRVLGGPVDRIELVHPRTLPKTPSGKLRRSACKELFETGKLGKRRAVWDSWLQIGHWAMRSVATRMLRSLGGLFYGLYAWLCVLLLAPIFLGGLSLLPSLAARQAFARAWGRLLCRICGIRIQTFGLGLLPPEREPAILVANHGSYVDALVLTAALPVSVRFVGKRELLSTPVLSLIFRRLGGLPVERFDAGDAMRSTRQISGQVRGETKILFFPEGTFTTEIGLKPFHMGAFVIAAETGTAVTPIAIRGTRRVLGETGWFPRPGQVKVTVFPRIAPRGGDWDAAIRLRDESRALIARESREPELPQWKIKLPSSI